MSEGTQRRLTTVVAADIADFSRLVGVDEEATLAAQRRHRNELIEPLLSEHHGRIANTAGDSFLFEFPSTVEAVRCAVSVQDSIAERNRDVPADRRIEYRIGVNVGDVVADGDDLLGDGVNIAARLENLCEPGGILLSDDAYRQVRDRLEIAWEDGGEQEVKNIARPIRIWHWPKDARRQDAVPAIGGDLFAPLDKPSIAVLPFDNMSGDPEQEYFSDGITEDIITGLSKFRLLFVSARNSTFSYKGKAPNIKDVGAALGVRYVLEGSVRKAGDRLRITAQLIDAMTGNHVWAERFDRQMDDVFKLQDDIVANIATAVGPEITLAEIERTRTKRPETLDAWDHYLRAVAAYNKTTKNDLLQAVSHLREAIDIEPDFANAYALLVLCHVQIGVYGWVRPVRQAFEEARRLADIAIRLAPSTPESNQALAFVLMATGEAEEAVTAARRAIELNPNYAEAYASLGHALVLCGEMEQGLEACRRAVRSSPRDLRGTWLLDAFGHAYFMLGDYEMAIEVSKQGRQRDPSLIGALLTLAGSCAQLGRADEAKRYVDELLLLVPRFSLRALRKNPMFKKPEMVAKLVDSMRLAGLPE